ESNIQRQAITPIAIGIAHGMITNVRITRLPGKSPTRRNARQVPSTSLISSEVTVNWIVFRSARWKIEFSIANSKFARPTKPPLDDETLWSVTENQSASKNG